MRDVYLYHIPKTGGRSLRLSFLAYFVEPVGLNPVVVHNALWSGTGKYFNLGNGIILGGPDNNFIFDSSHITYDLKTIKNGTFTVSIFRNPTTRTLSYFRMLDRWQYMDEYNAWLDDEKYLLENGFEGFIKFAPDEIILAQTRMFSENYDVNEAFENIKNISHIIILENYEEDLKLLSEKLNMKLKMFNFYGKGKRLSDEEIMGNNRNRLLKLLKKRAEKEYYLYELVKQYVKKQ
jgi:hypothetical protein